MSALDRAFRVAVDEITDDIEAGRVNFRVGSFAELHEYVDANEYGGLCDDAVVGDMSAEEHIAFGNALQARLDAWIKAGRPKAAR